MKTEWSSVGLLNPGVDNKAEWGTVLYVGFGIVVHLSA